MLRDYSSGILTPDEMDEFPDVQLSPALDEMEGPLLTIRESESLTLYGGSRMSWYRNSVKVLNKKCLSNRGHGVEEQSGSEL